MAFCGCAGGAAFNAERSCALLVLPDKWLRFSSWLQQSMSGSETKCEQDPFQGSTVRPQKEQRGHRRPFVGSLLPRNRCGFCANLTCTFFFYCRMQQFQKQSGSATFHGLHCLRSA